ncbi:MAG: arginine--tRNA ligase, partial [Bacteroidales bacterium]|nr:arginine--tRNA ligase [Bacteroidales bacterium]
SEYKLDSHVYVVGDEQNYHFQVLKLVLSKLGFDWAQQIFHLSYGMVELPEGKMKSREGTVVDADDLIEKMYEEAKATSEESGKLEDVPAEERERLYRSIGLGALKYFILKVDPKKKMLFNPRESIDFNGNTGPFIQYTHARICSILRKAAGQGACARIQDGVVLSPKEVRLVQWLSAYPQRVAEAAAAYSPALMANYAYDLAKEFNQYYHDTPVLKEPDAALKEMRLALIDTLASVLRKTTALLGMELPARM